MAIVEKHPAGTFSWIELGTSDQAGAKAFYTGLLGWDVVDHPMGPDAYYTMFKIGGLDVSAAYTLTKMEVEHHVPPHWNLYVSVEDADATVKKAAELGGTVVEPPFDVDIHGRMAVLQDPGGAYFNVWQPKHHIGVRRQGEVGTLCWAELSLPNRDLGIPFYSKLFGWTFELGEGDTSEYLHIKNGDQFIGGALAANQRPPDVPAHWMIYLMVDNCEASTAKAKELGANIFMGSMRMEGVGVFTALADPQGAVFSLFQPLPHSMKAA